MTERKLTAPDVERLAQEANGGNPGRLAAARLELSLLAESRDNFEDDAAWDYAVRLASIFRQ